MEGGLSIDAWLTLWRYSHAATSLGVWLTTWPDGKSALQQPALAVSMFDLIDDMLKQASNDG